MRVASSFMPVSAMPLIKARWLIKKTSSTGRMLINDTAMVKCGSE